MRNDLWKKLIVFVCIISTLWLQGFSCYAASSEISEMDAFGDYASESSVYSGHGLDEGMDSASDFNIEAADTGSVGTGEVNTDAEDPAAEDKIADTEDSAIEGEDETADAKVPAAEDSVAETGNVKTENTENIENVEIENGDAKTDNADALNSSLAETLTNAESTVLNVAVGEDERVIAVEQPSISECGIQPFDFILDPQRLITATNGVKYGNVSFEEGSTVYFRNLEGSYDYSSRSDQLTIKNRGTASLVITLTAELRNDDNISLTNDPTFKGDNRTSLYFALVDNKDNVIPLSEDGKVEIVYELEGISKDDTVGVAVADKYSFGLIGACNPNGNWENLTELPQVVVAWEVNPILDNKDTGSEDSISDNSISMNGVSDNSISMNGVSDNSVSGNGVSDNSISMNSVSGNGVSDNSISMNGVSGNGVSDNSISMNGVSDNSASGNGVSDNSISMNGVSDNSASGNGVSDNSISMNGVSGNSVSGNGVSDNSIQVNGVSQNEPVQSLEQDMQNIADSNSMEETETESQDLAANVSVPVSENNVAEQNKENEANMIITTSEEDGSDLNHGEQPDSEAMEIKDNGDSIASASDTVEKDAMDGGEAGNGARTAAADGNDAGTSAANVNMTSETSAETVSALSDGGMQTGNVSLNVEISVCLS